MNSDLVACLDENLREFFEERAAIREFDGGLPGDHAECAALLDTLRRDPLALVGVTVLQVQLGGVRRVVLTTDVARLSAMGATVLGAADLPKVLSTSNGIAVLTSFDELRTTCHLI